MQASYPDFLGDPRVSLLTLSCEEAARVPMSDEMMPLIVKFQRMMVWGYLPSNKAKVKKWWWWLELAPGAQEDTDCQCVVYWFISPLS